VTCGDRVVNRAGHNWLSLAEDRKSVKDIN